ALKTAIVLLAVALAAQAQTHTAKNKTRAAAAPAEPKGAFPLVTVSVEGVKTLDEKAILAVAALKPGQQVTKADFEAARKRLDETGYFQSVGYSYGPAGSGPGAGYALKLQVVEEPQLYKVMFMDLPATDAELRDLLKKNDPLFAGRAPATNPIV